MGSFSDLWFGISQINHNFFQYFCSDIVLDIFWVEVNDLENEYCRMQIYLFLYQKILVLLVRWVNLEEQVLFFWCKLQTVFYQNLPKSETF